MTPIATAIQIAGGPSKVARLLKCSVQAVCFYRDGKRKLPAHHCPDLEKATGVPCESLRPDVNWAYLRGQTAPALPAAAAPADTPAHPG